MNNLDLNSKSVMLLLEPLERRMFLCSTMAELIRAGLPASMVRDDGHILRTDFETLSPELQKHADPHWIAEPHTESLDYDAILGIPLHPAGEEPDDGLNAVTEVLPDFFPQLDSTITITQTLQPGRTLAEFGTQVNNQGHGPGILVSGNAGDAIPSGAPITSWINPDGSQNVLQAIYTFNDQTNQFALSRYRMAGHFSYHPAHGHMHFEGYAFYRLRHNTAGVPGDYVQRSDGTGVVGEKTGFCLINTAGSFIMENGQSSTTLPGYRITSPFNGQPATGCGLLQGIRVGQADEYGKGLEGQWVDVTGVPNGQYFLEISLDGENALQEENETNNAKTFLFTLNANPPSGGIPADEFDTGSTHNDTLATAADMGVMGVYTKTALTIHWGQDFDYFEFEAASTGAGTITTSAANGNIDLYLHDATGVELMQSTNLGTTSDSVTWDFVKGQRYYIKVATYNSTTSSNYQVAYNIKPSVSYPVIDAVASEMGTNVGKFEVTRNGPTTSPLLVTLSIGGSATPGVDYTLSSPDSTLNGDVLSIGDLQSTATIIVTPIRDFQREDQETVTLTIVANGLAYVSEGYTQTVTIDDKPRRQEYPGGGPILPMKYPFSDHPLLDDEATSRIPFDERFASI